MPGRHLKRAWKLKKTDCNCIVITNDGKMTGNLMGIVTPWDIIDQSQK